MKWIFSTLESSFHKKDFDCGKPELNEYLKKYATQDKKKGYAITFVAMAEGSKEVAGYYSTSASTIEFNSIPDAISKRLPRYPAPAMLIGRLAVDQKAQGQGLGEVLLMHALSRAVDISSELGIFAVRVDALDKEAKNFYLKYGFVSFQDNKLSLLLPIATIRASRHNDP